MFPAIIRTKKKFQQASFGTSVLSSGVKTKKGYIYALSSPLLVEPEGHFYVSGAVTSGGFKGYVVDGYVNGLKVDGKNIEGAAPCYVCLKLTAPNGGNVSIEVRQDFGHEDDTYYYPLASFGVNGKIAQTVFSGLLYRARRKVPGFYWMHEVSAA